MPECFKDQIFPSIPKSAFSSHHVFPSSRSWSPSRFPCVPCPLFPLEGAGSSGRAGRAAAASSSSSSSSSTAAAGQRHLRGPPEVTLGTHWGCPCPQFHTNGGSDQSTRGLNALQQNYIWFQPIRKPNNRMQSTKKQHVSVHTHAPLPPSRPAAFNRLMAAFSALRVMILKLALQVLLNLLFQPFPGSRAQLLPLSPNLWVPDLFLVATGIPLHRQNLTQHEWTCFSHSVQIPLVRDAASQAEIHSMERRSAWQEKDSGPAEMAPSCGVTHTIPQNTFLYLLQPSGHSPPWGEGN